MNRHVFGFEKTRFFVRKDHGQLLRCQVTFNILDADKAALAFWQWDQWISQGFFGANNWF